MLVVPEEVEAELLRVKNGWGHLPEHLLKDVFLCLVVLPTAIHVKRVCQAWECLNEQAEYMTADTAMDYIDPKSKPTKYSSQVRHLIAEDVSESGDPCGIAPLLRVNQQLKAQAPYSVPV